MKKIFITILAIGSLCLNSCSDYLDILPKDKQTSDMFWESSDDVESILAEGYSCMRKCVPYMIDWGELRGSSVITYETGKNRAIQDFTVLPNNEKVKWNDFYAAIGMANAVLKYAPGVMDKDESYKEAQMKSHLTEAYFMRALTYFYLVRNYKEVPLITEPYVDDEMPTNVAKSSEAEIIAQIKYDVEAALQTGAAKEMYENSWANKCRATKWALYALMSDVCLWSEDYDGCITYANNLIQTTSGMRPVFMSNPSQWFQLFYREGDSGGSNESIFELIFDGNENPAAAKYSPTQIIPYKESSPSYLFSERMTEDLNIEFIAQNARTHWGSYPGPEHISANYPNNGLIWKYTGVGTDDTDASRPSSGKNAYSNFIIYRMADVMLMKAEALIRKGGDANWEEAIALINQIRERSELEPLNESLEDLSEEDLLDKLLYERNMEFAAEGKRWYDLLRLGRQRNFQYKSKFITMILEYNNTTTTKRLSSVLQDDNAWFLPLPDGDVKANKLLIQNPYYDVTK